MGEWKVVEPDSQWKVVDENSTEIRNPTAYDTFSKIVTQNREAGMQGNLIPANLAELKDIPNVAVSQLGHLIAGPAEIPSKLMGSKTVDVPEPQTKYGNNLNTAATLGQIAAPGLEMVTAGAKAVPGMINEFINRPGVLSKSDITGQTIKALQDAQAQKIAEANFRKMRLSRGKMTAVDTLKSDAEMLSSRIDEQAVNAAKVTNQEYAWKAIRRLNNAYENEFLKTTKDKSVKISDIRNAIDSVVYKEHGPGGLHASNYDNMDEGQKALFNLSNKFKEMQKGIVDAEGKIVPGSEATDAKYPIDQLWKDLKDYEKTAGKSSHLSSDMRYALGNFMGDDFKAMQARFKPHYQDKARFMQIFNPADKAGKVDTATSFLKRYANGTLNKDQAEYLSRINDPNNLFNVSNDSLGQALRNADEVASLENRTKIVKRAFDNASSNIDIKNMLENGKTQNTIRDLENIKLNQQLVEARVKNLKTLATWSLGGALGGGIFAGASRGIEKLFQK